MPPNPALVTTYCLQLLLGCLGQLREVQAGGGCGEGKDKVGVICWLVPTKTVPSCTQPGQGPPTLGMEGFAERGWQAGKGG